jgi:molecular chaperone GrpE
MTLTDKEPIISDDPKDSTKRKSQVKKLTETIDQLTAKVAELEEHLKNKEAQLVEVNDKFLRLMADFDNYRKRREKEIEQITEYAGEEVLRQILPILDDFERALNGTESAENQASLREGFDLIYRKFLQILKNLGVEAFNSLNQPFDPDLHYAIMQREEPGQPPETVVAEFEKGYKYRNRILRHAKVVVSK